MKTLHTLTTVTALLVGTYYIELTEAKGAYLTKIPNGDTLGEEAGHTDGKVNAFGKAFASQKHTWTPKLCGTKDAALGMTYGEAFGDPCCTWNENADPDFPVVKVDGKFIKNVCAKDAGAGSDATGEGTDDYGEETTPAPTSPPTEPDDYSEDVESSAPPAPSDEADDYSEDVESSAPPAPSVGPKKEPHPPVESPAPSTHVRDDCDVEDESTDEEEVGSTPPEPVPSGAGGLDDYRRLRRV